MKSVNSCDNRRQEAAGAAGDTRNYPNSLMTAVRLFNDNRHLSSHNHHTRPIRQETAKHVTVVFNPLLKCWSISYCWHCVHCGDSVPSKTHKTRLSWANDETRYQDIVAAIFQCRHKQFGLGQRWISALCDLLCHSVLMINCTEYINVVIILIAQNAIE